ncbi:MAG: hypothetical protein V7K57_15795 [Nostoc sp.]
MKQRRIVRGMNTAIAPSPRPTSLWYISINYLMPYQFYDDRLRIRF